MHQYGEPADVVAVDNTDYQHTQGVGTDKCQDKAQREQRHDIDEAYEVFLQGCCLQFEECLTPVGFPGPHDEAGTIERYTDLT